MRPGDTKAVRSTAPAGALPLRSRFLGRVAYEDALQLQESLVAARIAGGGCDELLLLEHDHVYTLGRGADEGDLRQARRRGVPVHRVGRGGGVTYHGPGQLVAYPLVRITDRDVHRHIRRLEQVLVATCARYGVGADEPAGRTGVWVGGEKIASVGIGVRRGISFHGVALNVDPDLEFFSEIVACRSPDLRVTSLARQLERVPPLREVARVLSECFALVFGYTRMSPLPMDASRDRS